MELRPALQIQTVIKAMLDVILPAVDPNNRMAQEQAGLVVGMLNLLAQRLPLAYRYDCVELSRLLEFAENLRSKTAGIRAASESLESLAASARVGEDVLERAKAEPSELEQAVFDLREKIGALIQAAYAEADGPAVLKSIGATVLEASREQLLRERVWVIGQGWESKPDELPSLETLIGDGPLSADPAAHKQR